MPAGGGGLWHITLPGMRGVIVLMLVLRLGNALTVGFEQMLIQRQAVGRDASDVLDTFAYYYGVGQQQLQLRRRRRALQGRDLADPDLGGQQARARLRRGRTVPEMTTTDCPTRPARARRHDQRPAWEEQPTAVGQAGKGAVLLTVVLAVMLVPLWTRSC